MPVTKSLRTYTTRGFYHKFSQLRSDSWSRLKEQRRRLLDDRANDTEKRVARRGVIALMRLLERIEDYTAFPSKKDFDYLQTLYNAKDFRKLNQVVKRIDAALTSDAYRTREIDLEGLTDKNNPREDWQGRPHSHKGYFEMLVVDDFVSTEHDE